MQNFNENKIELVLVTSIPTPYTVVLFNAYAPQPEIKYPDALINNQAGFVNAMSPMLSNFGLFRMVTAAPGFEFRNIVMWTEEGNMQAYDTGLLQNWTIATASLSFSYKALIEWLKSHSVLVKKIRIQSIDPAQLSNAWKIIQRYPSGKVKEEIVINTSTIAPTQVQAGIAEIDFNRTIDAFTSIEIPLTANANVNLKFYL